MSSIYPQLSRDFQTILPTTPKEATLLGTGLLCSLFYSTRIGFAISVSYGLYKGFKWVSKADPLEVPNLSQIPPLTAFERKKIEGLANQDNCIAITKVQNLENSQWELAYVVRRPDDYPGREHFSIYNFQDECLGTARVDPLSLSDTKFQARWDVGVPRRFRGYGNEKVPDMTDKVEIYSLYTKEDPVQRRYKYTGFALLKSIEEQYREHFKGRTILDSKPGAIGFYYKLGFRSPDPSLNRRIAKVFACSSFCGSRPKTEHFGKIPMFLPYEAGLEWQRRPPLPKPSDLL